MERRPGLAKAGIIPALALMFAAAACSGGANGNNPNNTTNTSGGNTNPNEHVTQDTTINSTRVKDTTVVKHDTTVNTDTVKKTTHGKKAKNQ